MGRLDFGQPTTYLAPPVAHSLHNDDTDVVNGDVAEAHISAYLIRRSGGRCHRLYVLGLLSGII